MVCRIAARILQTLSVLALLGHLSHRERQEALGRCLAVHKGAFGAACKNPDLWLTQVGGVFSVAGIVAEAFAEAGVEARLVSALGKVRHTAEVCHTEACKTLLALLGM